MTNITNTTLKIADIRLDGGTQPRVEMNQEVIDEYAERMQEDGGLERFPGVTVFHDGANYWLADGFHRIFAARQAEIDEFQAMVHEGSQRDAILYSIGANAHHGLRRSNEDKRAAVLRLLDDEIWAKWGNREIARWAGVSDRFVGNLRNELSANGSQIGERLVRRGGTEYTMNTSEIAAANADRATFHPDPDAHWFDNYEAACDFYKGKTVFMGIGQRGTTWVAIGTTAARVGEKIRNMAGVVKVGDAWLPSIKIAMWEPERTEHLEKLVGSTAVYLESAEELEKLADEIKSATLYGAPVRPGMPQSALALPTHEDQIVGDDIAQDDDIDPSDPAPEEEQDPTSQQSDLTAEEPTHEAKPQWKRAPGESDDPPLDVANETTAAWLDELIGFYADAEKREYDEDRKAEARRKAAYLYDVRDIIQDLVDEDDIISSDAVSQTVPSADAPLTEIDPRSDFEGWYLGGLIAGLELVIKHHQQASRHANTEETQALRLWANFHIEHGLGTVHEKLLRRARQPWAIERFGQMIESAETISEMGYILTELKQVKVGNEGQDAPIEALWQEAETKRLALLSDDDDEQVDPVSAAPTEDISDEESEEEADEATSPNRRLNLAEDVGSYRIMTHGPLARYEGSTQIDPGYKGILKQATQNGSGGWKELSKVWFEDANEAEAWHKVAIANAQSEADSASEELSA